MRIFQTIPVIAYGDAVSNDALALEKVIKEAGHETRIYAKYINPPLTENAALHSDKLTGLKPDDIVIHHMSTGSSLNREFAGYNCRKIMVYHNITPPEYFDGFNFELARVNYEALHEFEALADKVDLAIADSEFNKQDVIKAGFKCPAEVLPILIPFADYDKEPDEETIGKYSDGRTNIIFTGRIAPNKKQEDVIRAFACYKKYYDPGARLFLVGGHGADPDLYYEDLLKFTKRIGVKDVIFTGHVKFAEILAYYKLADVFLCMSEHEGFCVPLVEAMYFDVPVAAYGAAAVPGTLGGSGICLDRKDPMLFAGVIDRLKNDPELKKAVVAGQRERLKDFSYESIKAAFTDIMKRFDNRF
ncbi:MAG: glycosyltransferase family 4 protein [Lachnospiraceae bacterium]|nr:glycosyltransferase family 4 protein [Lachnospiraceae bacterium]